MSCAPPACPTCAFTTLVTLGGSRCVTDFDREPRHPTYVGWHSQVYTDVSLRLSPCASLSASKVPGYFSTAHSLQMADAQ